MRSHKPGTLTEMYFSQVGSFQIVWKPMEPAISRKRVSCSQYHKPRLWVSSHLFRVRASPASPDSGGYKEVFDHDSASFCALGADTQQEGRFEEDSALPTTKA